MSRLVTIALVYPVFLIMSFYPTTAVLYAMAALLTWANAPGSAAGVVFITECFPRPVRAIGLATTYALGISVFGGTT